MAKSQTGGARWNFWGKKRTWEDYEVHRNLASEMWREWDVQFGGEVTSDMAEVKKQYHVFHTCHGNVH